MCVGTLTFRGFHGINMTASCTLMITPLLYSSLCYTNCFGPGKYHGRTSRFFVQIYKAIIPCLEQQPAEVLSAVGGDWAKPAVQSRIWNWGEIGRNWPNFPPTLDSTEDAEGGFPEIQKEWLVLPSLVAEDRHSWDWINKSTTFIMPWLKALQGRHWLTGLLLLILYSPSRGRMRAEVWHIWISSKCGRYLLSHSNFNVRNRLICWSVPGFWIWMFALVN